ncbi:MAG: hypothetical protein AB8B62_06700 [Roseobacter sp.]
MTFALNAVGWSGENHRDMAASMQDDWNLRDIAMTSLSQRP